MGLNPIAPMPYVVVSQRFGFGHTMDNLKETVGFLFLPELTFMGYCYISFIMSNNEGCCSLELAVWANVVRWRVPSIISSVVFFHLFHFIVHVLFLFYLLFVTSLLMIYCWLYCLFVNNKKNLK